MLIVISGVATKKGVFATLRKKYGILTGIKDIVIGFNIGGVLMTPELFDSNISK